MKEHTKRFLVAGCLCVLFVLAACGGGSPAADPTAVPHEPEETGAPIMIDPSAQPDAPVQAAETTAPEPGPDDGAQSPSDPEPPSASGSFTGVQGTEFVVPEGFVRLDESPSIGYQYTFWHPDHEIRIVVYEIAPGYIPEGAYETDLSIARRNPDVTYFSDGENWFVQSGYDNNGEEIFYSKESMTDRGLKTFWISYPTAKREFGDPVAADFEKNCRF